MSASMMLKRFSRVSTSAAAWRVRKGGAGLGRGLPAARGGLFGHQLRSSSPTSLDAASCFGWGGGRRSLVCSAAVNASDSTEAAVGDCLERVLGPTARAPCDFAVMFFEGHNRAAVQDELESFAESWPQAPPVIGCSLGDGGKEQRQRILRARSSTTSLSSPPPKPLRSPTIVTVLGMGFGGRVEAIPVSADGGCFPSIAGDDSISRIFALPLEKQPVFLVLCRNVVPVSDLEDTFWRLGNLLPGSTRLSALSSGDPSSVVSSFPADNAPVVGVCLLGDISLQEQAELARKTLGAFGVDEVSVSGGVCDELFVPSTPPLPPPLPPSRNSPSPPPPSETRATEAGGGLANAGDRGTVLGSSAGDTAATAIAGDGGDFSGDAEMGPGGDAFSGASEVQHASQFKLRQHEQQRKQQQQQQQQQQAVVSSVLSERQQLCVFMVEDFVFPGMTRRFRIFEPRYRALVKRCLREAEPLLILPLARGGNTVGTAAYVSGLHNVEEDGRCEIEITGISRCNVKTMWMKGESFGLHEAVVEYFGDDEQDENDNHSDLSAAATVAVSSAVVSTGGRAERHHLRSVTAASTKTMPSSSDEVPAASADERKRGGDAAVGFAAGDGTDGGVGSTAAGVLSGEGEDGEGLVAELPELERLRIQVSAVLQRELFRTRKVGRSPLWPGWNGMPAHAALSSSSAFSGADGDSDSDGDSGEGNGIGAIDPCDLDAETLSYWAAQNIEADVLTKHRWLTCTDTQDRLREIRGACEVTMARYRDRSRVDGGVLAKPLSALNDLLSK